LLNLPRNGWTCSDRFGNCRKTAMVILLDEAGGLADSLDQKLYDAVKEQASEAGLEYEDGPAY